jgi:hypothetical protein
VLAVWGELDGSKTACSAVSQRAEGGPTSHGCRAFMTLEALL